MAEAKNVKKTYKELLLESQELARQAEDARVLELDSVIRVMREDINFYKITADQLGFSTPEPLPAAPTPSKRNKDSKSGVKRPKPVFDDDGNKISFDKDGKAKPFFYYNPDGKEKAYNTGRKPAWLEAYEKKHGKNNLDAITIKTTATA